MLDFVPEEFSYCQPSPFAVTSGKNKVLIDDIVTTFYVGPIELNYANTTTLYDPCYANVHTGNTATIFEEMEYAYADETNIEDIKDPSRYLYNEVGIKKLKRPSLGSLTIAKVQPNQILLVRDSYKYAAIRIIEVERKNWQEVDPLIRKSWKDEISEGLLCPFLKSVTYEWKYWPVYPTGLAKASSLTRE